MRRYRRKDGSLYEKRNNSPYRRYQCIRSVKKRASCPRKSISAQRLEELVWQEVKKILISPVAITEMIEARHKEFETDSVDKSLAKARKNLELLEQERGRRLSQHAKGYITEPELDLALRGLAERIEMYSEEIERLETETRDYRQYVSTLDRFFERTESVRNRIQDLSEDERTEIIHMIVNKVVIDPMTIKITLIFDGVAKKSEATY